MNNMNNAECKIARRSRKKKKRLGFVLDGLMAGGWLLVSAGAAICSLPAGLIVAGVLAIAGGVLLGRGLKA